MKQQIRILGIDDSPFEFGDGRSLVVGVLMRAPAYIEAVMKTEVTVDGSDATAQLVGMVSRSRYREQIHAIMLDGIALAGFNVVDIESLHASLGIPVVTVTRDPPDYGRIEVALRKHFDDWGDRLDLIKRLDLVEIETPHKPLYACGLGLGPAELRELVGISTVRGVLPEPVRAAHLIASAMVRGESRGRS
jgi:endonuclease V-like protein UPF0215 family